MSNTETNRACPLLFYFLFCSCVCFCFYGPFNRISFHLFSRQLSVFSLCSFGLISVLLVLSTTCLFIKVSFSPDVIPRGWLGSIHQLTTSHTYIHYLYISDTVYLFFRIPTSSFFFFFFFLFLLLLIQREESDLLGVDLFVPCRDRSTKCAVTSNGVSIAAAMKENNTNIMMMMMMMNGRRLKTWKIQERREQRTQKGLSTWKTEGFQLRVRELTHRMIGWLIIHSCI